MENKEIVANRYGRDSELTLAQYWSKNRLEIANMRGWICQDECHYKMDNCERSCKNEEHRHFNCSTLQNYTRYVNTLSEFIKKPVSEICMDDLRMAVDKIREKYGYQETTLSSMISCITIIFRYAHMLGDAYDFFRYTRNNFSALIELLCSGKKDSVIRQFLEDEREKLADKTKSFTIAQIEKLLKYCWDNIERDGRLCLIVLMLFAGVRPAEGRFLRWKDITSFKDHPNRKILNLTDTRDKKGRAKGRMKSNNAYRRSPIHLVLDAFLEKRKRFIENNCDEDIGEYVIGCYKNEFNRACRDYEAAAIIDEIFTNELKLKRSEMYVYAVEHIADKLNKSEIQAELFQYITLYSLRRNYWTWLESCTTLSQIEKLVLMGHDLGDEKREEYNNENLLWEMCQKIDGCVMFSQLHELNLNLDIANKGAETFKDRGIVRVRVSKEMIVSGCKIRANVITSERNDTIKLTVSNFPKMTNSLKVNAHVYSSPSERKNSPINCQYDNWRAHERAYKKIDKNSDKTAVDAAESGD